jgi:hypothetical protein
MKWIVETRKLHQEPTSMVYTALVGHDRGCQDGNPSIKSYL